MRSPSIPDSGLSPGPHAESVAQPARSPFFPEGLSTFLLLIALVACASASVESGDWERIVIPVTFIGVSAAIFGSLLAKLRVLDSLAHFFSMLIGILGSFGLVLTQANDLAPTLRGRVRPLLTITSDWYLGHGQIEGHEVYLVSMLMGIIVWLVGYLAAWTLFRRGWLMAAVLLPAFLVLINLLYAPHADRRFLAIYLVLAIPLAARFHLYRRQREWARARVPSPVSGGMKFLTIGTVLGVLITTAGWNAPDSLSQQAFQPLAQKMSSQISDMQARIDSLTKPSGTMHGTSSGGSYTSFGSSFTVGGSLNLTNEPEMLVQSAGDAAPYLAAQRYDVYNGRGWSTDIDTTFSQDNGDGKSYLPALTFRPNQDVLLSDDVDTARTETNAQITTLTDRDSTLFTIDTYLTASIGTSVRMSWRQLDDVPFALNARTLGDVPPDLRQIAALLLQSRLTGEDKGSGALPVDVAAATQITDEQANLARRFLTVRWTVGDDGRVDTLFVTGQLPVYDDVETVNSGSSQVQGATYQVTGSASVATVDELNQAGSDYPDWVTSRYLQQSPTVTNRTVDLAMSIAPADLTPYQKAVEIQDYLRTHITYDETVDAPPAGVDMVDYVLFDRQRGYCEYYASAMAVMLRAVGVPARVVTGYYPGDFDASQDGYVYLQSNAHAWVEAFFPGYGWIQFEPTASRPAMTQGDTPAAQTPPKGNQQAAATEVAPNQSVVTPTATPAVQKQAAQDQEPPQVTPAQRGGGSSDWKLIIGGVIAAVLGVSLAGWALWSWRLRGLAPSTALFVRLTRLGRFAGVRTSSVTTPHEFGEQFARTIPAARDRVERIVRVYELDQYGPQGADGRLLESARQAWLGLRSRALRLIVRRRR